jgi:hypothetical protein
VFSTLGHCSAYRLRLTVIGQPAVTDIWTKWQSGGRHPGLGRSQGKYERHSKGQVGTGDFNDNTKGQSTANGNRESESHGNFEGSISGTLKGKAVSSRSIKSYSAFAARE